MEVIRKQFHEYKVAIHSSEASLLNGKLILD